MRSILCLALSAYQLVVLAYVIFAWVPRPPEPLLPVVRGVGAMVDPLLAPIRRVVRPAQVGGVALDLSILVLFLAIFLVQAVVC
jgi:YggT family protein